MIPIPNYLSAWTALAPALGDHLWQSTLFAVAAGLLTLLLRKNHARARYWLWLAASLKFLIPFSALVSIGSHLAWSRVTAGTNVGLYSAMEEVSRPFTQPTISASSGVLASTISQNLIQLLPAILATVWLCGFVTVLLVWFARWRKVSRAIRDAMPLLEGREVQALRRMERAAVVRQRIEMVLSSSTLEPGIFGILRPVLMWPKGISKHLDDAQLEAILAHEMWHVLRRDNLAAAIHMVVEAIFWFHPLVWWLGGRLVEERELACDEEVLQMGNHPQAYAESILKTCEFCLQSPMACMSGVTGADLKKRIVHIMTERVGTLDFSKKLLLGVAALVAVAAPIVFGLANPAPEAGPQASTPSTSKLTYEVASIKPDKSAGNMMRIMNTPDGLTATVPLHELIRLAYGVQTFQISGAPDWAKSDKYNIEAKMDKSTVDELSKISEDQRQPTRQRMLQALLAERFKLTLHRETKELPVYDLIIAKGGPKLEQAKPGDPDPEGLKGPDGRPMPGGHFVRMGRGELTGQDLGIDDMVRVLSQQLDRTVVDKTGLKGSYNWTLKWTPDQSTPMFRGAGDPRPGPASGPAPDSSAPSIFTAVQEQLGLKLEPQKGPVEILVIDHVEKPSEN